MEWDGEGVNRSVQSVTLENRRDTLWHGWLNRENQRVRLNSAHLSSLIPDAVVEIINVAINVVQKRLLMLQLGVHIGGHGLQSTTQSKNRVEGSFTQCSNSRMALLGTLAVKVAKRALFCNLNFKFIEAILCFRAAVGTAGKLIYYSV